MDAALSFWSVLLIALIKVDAIGARNANREQYRSIASHMDQDVDPCENFYDYACGNWGKVHESADYFETIGLVDYKANMEFARIIKTLKKEARSSTGQPQFIRNVVEYYRSCISVEAYEPVRYLKLLKMYEKVTWPTPVPRKRSTNKDSNEFDWLQLLGVLRKYGLNGIFLEQTVIQQRDNARVSLVDLDKPVLKNGFELLEHKAFALVLEYLGVIEHRKLAPLWDQLQVFEVKLKSLDDIEDEAGYELQTLAQLNMTWLDRYLGIVMEQSVVNSMKITTQNLPYFKALSKVLDDYEPEFICRYLMIRFIWFVYNDGPRNFLKNDCISHTRSLLPLAMHWLYEQHNPQLLLETDTIKTMFKNLLNHFNETLQQNPNSFDAEILQFLSAKAAAIHIKFGNLPRPSTLEKVTEFYKDMEVNASDFYANHLRLLHFYSSAKLKQLHTLLPEGDALFFLEDAETGASSSPYYLIRSNVIIVPMTLLQPPIYHSHFHDVLKYSMLGFLLAHEITHGFDNSGVEFDQRGNLRAISEAIKDNEVFDRHLSCLGGKNPQSIDEKVADVSGLRLAYETYFKNASVDTQPQNPLRWSAERVFFLNFAQFFCGDSDLEFDEHGSDRQRVMDSLANFAQFGPVYDCPLGSPLHPQEKCQLWR